MKTYRLALIGFGSVGRGLVQILQERGAALAQQTGAQLQVVAVATQRHGSVYHAAGLQPAALLAAAGTQLSTLAADHHNWDTERIITTGNADIIVECSPTNLQTGEPATGYIQAALRSGRHVVTANKGPVALHYAALAALARAQRVTLGVEGTVMGGTPALRLGSELLQGAGISACAGILNGTTNYILTRMEAGATYPAALAEAQALGYAEADPAGDVEGHDAACKLVIIANILMGRALRLQDVAVQGITQLTPAAMTAAASAGERWKLVATVDAHAAQVRPQRLALAHPLAAVSGITNAITFSTAVLGDVTLVGPGAGGVATGFALLADILAVHRTQTAA